MAQISDAKRGALVNRRDRAAWAPYAVQIAAAFGADRSPRLLARYAAVMEQARALGAITSSVITQRKFHAERAAILTRSRQANVVVHRSATKRALAPGGIYVVRKVRKRRFSM